MPDSLFDQNPAPLPMGRRGQKAVAQEDSATSVAAAIAIQIKVGSIDHTVLARIRQSPCTDQEGQDDTGIDGNTWRPSRRRNELAGLILADGTRATRSGRQASVWRAARAGEPPGTRTARSPAGESGASGEAVATGQRQVQVTRTSSPEVGPLWQQVWDAKPGWMRTPHHRRIVDEALERHPHDTGAGLRQALAELKSMGGAG